MRMAVLKVAGKLHPSFLVANYSWSELSSFTARETMIVISSIKFPPSLRTPNLDFNQVCPVHGSISKKVDHHSPVYQGLSVHRYYVMSTPPD
jgi:hypothetical protein